jgi:hypothetical protein
LSEVALPASFRSCCVGQIGEQRVSSPEHCGSKALPGERPLSSLRAILRCSIPGVFRGLSAAELNTVGGRHLVVAPAPWPCVYVRPSVANHLPVGMVSFPNARTSGSLWKLRPRGSNCDRMSSVNVPVLPVSRCQNGIIDDEEILSVAGLCAFGEN